MEVLYLDSQRKLSELQTEFRTKEAEHENEMHSMQTDYQLRLETEITEKKRLAKELVGNNFFLIGTPETVIEWY